MMTREQNAEAEALLAAHEGKVQALARRHLREGVELEDLVQVGRVAVMQACAKLDSARPGEGHSYVWQTIHFKLMDYVRCSFSTIRVPNGQFGRVWRDCVPLDAPRFEDGETTLADRLAAEPAEVELDGEERAILLEAVKALPVRERVVIEQLFMQAVPVMEVAKQRGCSRQYVDQITAKALKRLRSMGRLRDVWQAMKSDAAQRVPTQRRAA